MKAEPNADGRHDIVAKLDLYASADHSVSDVWVDESYQQAELVCCFNKGIAATLYELVITVGMIWKESRSW